MPQRAGCSPDARRPHAQSPEQRRGRDAAPPRPRPGSGRRPLAGCRGALDQAPPPARAHPAGSRSASSSDPKRPPQATVLALLHAAALRAETTRRGSRRAPRSGAKSASRSSVLRKVARPAGSSPRRGGQRSALSVASVTHGPNSKWKAPETSNACVLTPFLSSVVKPGPLLPGTRSPLCPASPRTVHGLPRSLSSRLGDQRDCLAVAVPWPSPLLCFTWPQSQSRHCYYGVLLQLFCR